MAPDGVRGVDGLDLGLWRAVVRLYRGDPLTHVFLLYDLIYELDRTDAYFKVSGGEVAGYLLVWRGPRGLGVHVWGDAGELLGRMPLGERATVTIHSGGLLDAVLERLRGGGEARVRYYLDMYVDEEGFRPHPGEGVVKLRSGCRRHVEAFLDLLRADGWDIDARGAGELLSRWMYYGLFRDGRLVSIACAFLRMQEVWPIGHVYTRPGYRGRGYAKTVTSAVTGAAVAAGAKAMLSVAEDNEPALRVYRALGYRVYARKPWVLYSPRPGGLVGLGGAAGLL